MSNVNPDETTSQKIVEAYERGARILEIEEEFDVARAALYNVLDKAGVLPNRANRGEKLKGNTEALASLYEIIDSKKRYVKQLEGLLETHGIEIPEEISD